MGQYSLEYSKKDNKSWFSLKLLIPLLLIIVLFGCVQEEENVSVEDVVEVQEEIEVPKPLLNITDVEEEENATIYKEYELDGNLSIYFLNASWDKKNARTILIKKGTLDIVVDLGSKEKRDFIFSFLKSMSDDIEVLVISSPLGSNLDNLEYGLNNLKIAEIWYSEENGLENIFQTAREKQITLRKVSRGEVIEFDGLEFLILNPTSPPEFNEGENNAIAFKLTYSNFSVLFATDLLGGALGRLNKVYGDSLKSTVLEYPSYGERVGQIKTRLFLSNVDPEVVVLEGYKPEDLENSLKFTNYNLIYKIYNFTGYNLWDYEILEISFENSSLRVGEFEG